MNRLINHKIGQIFRSLKDGRPAWLWIIGIFAAINFFLTIFLGYLFLNNYNIWCVISAVPQAPRRTVQAVIDWVKEIPYIPYQFIDDGLPRYDIVLTKADYEELLENLPRDISQFLTDENKIKKRAVFRHGKKVYEAKVGFRGDGSGHWFWPKKSWKVKLADGNYIDDMREINFILPDERQYIVEAFNNYRARKLGLPYLKEGWGVLYVNGVKQGVYYISESWGSEFLARNSLNDNGTLYGDKYPPSPKDHYSIYGKFDDIADFWKTYTSQPKEREVGDDENLSVSSSNIPDVSITALSQFFKVVNSEDEYFKKNIWNVVDKEDFYNWYMQSKLSGSYHQYWMNNARMYFDPEIGKMRVIPVDVGIYTDAIPYFFLGTNSLVDRLIKNPDFITEVERRLYKYVSDEKNLEEDLAYYDSLYKKVRIAFYQDHLDENTGKSFDKTVASGRDAIIANFHAISKHIESAEVENIVTLNAGTNGNLFEGKRILAELHVKEKSAAPIVLRSLSVPAFSSENSPELYEDVNLNGFLDSTDRKVGVFSFSAEKKEWVIGSLKEVFNPSLSLLNSDEINNIGNLEFAKKVYEISATEKKYFIAAENIAGERFKIKTFFENLISSKEIQPLREVYVDQSIFADFDAVSYSQDEFLAMNPIFYKIDDNTLGVGPGVFDLANTVVIPKGQILSVSSGTTLRFSPGVSFFSYGKILARSSSGNSIRFVKSGKDPWGVFALIEAPGTSVFDGVVFEDGGTGLINGAYFSGMLAAHHSDIIVRNSFFKGSTGDDALNVKHASSSIVSNQFTANQFDAIDLDWGNFSFVKDNVFEQNGDDAIDLGGAQGVVIMDNFIKKSGDKCISIGEKSVRPLIINNILSGCKIGVQVKDGSDPIIANNIIYGNDIGIDAYEKKGIYGGGYAEVYNSIIWGNKVSLSMDEFSTIKVVSSNVEGGWRGDGNIAVPPSFKDADGGNFTIGKGSDSILLLFQEGGERSVLTDYFGLNLEKIPIGLLNQ